MPERFNGLLRGVFIASRWSLAPLALGLAMALVIVVLQFFRELAHSAIAFAEMDDGAVMITVLKLVDLALIAYLVVLIVGAAVELLVPGGPARETGGPERSDGAAFGTIKLRLFASISAIAAIYLLERFIKVHSLEKTELLLEIAILLTFVVSGVLLAWMDRLADRQ